MTAAAAVAMTAAPAPTWTICPPRAWQLEALPAVLSAIEARVPSVVSAIMGAGKSILIAEICAQTAGRIVITVPTIALVDQLAATIGARVGQVGRYYTTAHDIDHRITIVCEASLAQYTDARPGQTDLWIADECHRTECERVISAHAALAPVAAIGFTATPFRSLDTEALSLWHALAHEYGAAQALRDGVIVPPVLRHWTGGQVPIDDACTDLIRRYGDGPGIVSALSIDDAESYAATLRQSGITAEAVHSRLPRAELAERIERLRTGAIRALVHVALLVEGVDLPWLRWLCLRRPVGSRVRFCQEVGRVLRAWPGKASAILIDPHDLFDSFGLSYEAILAGGARDLPDDQPGDAEARDLVEAAGLSADSPERVTRALDLARRYVRRLYLAWVAAGAIEQKIASTSWRRHDPSERQIQAVRWACAGLARDTAIPIEHRHALALVADRVAYLRRGDVSDLLSVGFALRDRRRARTVPLWPKLTE